MEKVIDFPFDTCSICTYDDKIPDLGIKIVLSVFEITHGCERGERAEG